MPTLICECGKRLNAAGAVPGRVGKCPACGARLVFGEPPAVGPPRVVDDAPAGYGLTSPAGRPETFVKPRAATRAPAPSPAAGPDRRGFVRLPATPETGPLGSLPYPLWDVGGLGVLAFLPPMLWLTSLFSAGLIPGYVLGADLVTKMGALTMVFPAAILWVLVAGRFLSYLELVLGSSSRGESHHPRWPTWDVFALLAPWGRLLLAGAVGLMPAVALAVIYWVCSGELHLLDKLAVGALLTLGLTYSGMAYAAVVLHGDPMAANPLTVLGAIRRAGLGASIGAVAPVGALLAAVVGGAVGLFYVPGFLLPAALTYPYWVASLYLLMVAGRTLGLFYHRHAKALGWFPDRPRWGGLIGGRGRPKMGFSEVPARCPRPPPACSAPAADASSPREEPRPASSPSARPAAIGSACRLRPRSRSRARRGYAAPRPSAPPRPTPSARACCTPSPTAPGSPCWR